MEKGSIKVNKCVSPDTNGNDVNCTTPAQKRSKLSLKAQVKGVKNEIPNSSCKKLNFESKKNGGVELKSSVDGVKDENTELVKDPCVGALYNLGNTCFLNSVLQILRYTRGFKEKINNLTKQIKISEKEKALVAKLSEKNKDKVYENDLTWRLINNLNDTFKKMQTAEERYRKGQTSSCAVKPLDVLQTIEDLNPMFEEGVQQDAHELLHCILAYVQDATKKLNNYREQGKVEKETNASIIDESDTLETNTLTTEKTEDLCCTVFGGDDKKHPIEQQSSSKRKRKSPLAISNKKNNSNFETSTTNVNVSSKNTNGRKEDIVLNHSKCQASESINQIAVIDQLDGCNDRSNEKKKVLSRNRRAKNKVNSLDDGNLSEKENSLKDFKSKESEEKKVIEFSSHNKDKSNKEPSVMSYFSKKRYGTTRCVVSNIDNNKKRVFGNEKVNLVDCWQQSKTEIKSLQIFPDNSRSKRENIFEQFKNEKCLRRRASYDDILVASSTNESAKNLAIRKNQSFDDTLLRNVSVTLTDCMLDRKQYQVFASVKTAIVPIKQCRLNESEILSRKKFGLNAREQVDLIDHFKRSQKIDDNEMNMLKNQEVKFTKLITKSFQLSENGRSDSLSAIVDGKYKNIESFQNKNEKIVTAVVSPQNTLFSISEDTSRTTPAKNWTPSKSPNVGLSKRVRVKCGELSGASAASNETPDKSRGVANLTTLLNNHKKKSEEGIIQAMSKDIKIEVDESIKIENMPPKAHNINNSNILNGREFLKTNCIAEAELIHKGEAPGGTRNEENSKELKIEEKACKKGDVESKNNISSDEGTKKNKVALQTSGKRELRKRKSCTKQKQNKTEISNFFKKPCQNLAEVHRNTELVTDVVKTLFQGDMALRTKCLECERYTERKEDYQDIAVPISEKKHSNQSNHSDDDDDEYEGSDSAWIFKSLQEVEQLRDDNKYYCDNCYRQCEAQRSMHYVSTPDILTLHLKRFAALSGYFGGFTKISRHVPTPFILPCIKDSCKRNCQDLHHSYELYGVVAHHGFSLSSGHYIAYVKAPPGAQFTSVSVPKSSKHQPSQSKQSQPKSSATDSKNVYDFDNNSASNGDCNVNNNNNSQRSSSEASTAEEMADPNNNADSNNNLDDAEMEDSGSVCEEVEEKLELWYECDDEYITEMTRASFEQVLSPSSNNVPYLLFYRRLQTD